MMSSYLAPTIALTKLPIIGQMPARAMPSMDVTCGPCRIAWDLNNSDESLSRCDTEGDHYDLGKDSIIRRFGVECADRPPSGGSTEDTGLCSEFIREPPLCFHDDAYLTVEEGVRRCDAEAGKRQSKRATSSMCVLGGVDLHWWGVRMYIPARGKLRVDLRW